MIALPSRAAWDALRASARALPPEAAQALASEWARDAQFEHASIASFGRFALELLAVGAPAELIERAHRAALDEIAHARLCFSLASLYAGTSLGPGPLPMDARAFATAPTLVSMARATVMEGCVNESLAAIEAKAARERAEPEAVRDALAAIEAQEAEHAGLAFAFVSWAIGAGGEPIRGAAREAFELARTELKKTASSVDRAPDVVATLARHGRLAPARRSALRAQATEELIAPAMHDLLSAKLR